MDTANDGGSDKGPLLGRQVPGSATYDPSLLFPVPRANARSSLPLHAFTGHGADVWHAYELSWLNAQGMPQMFLGRLLVPATTPSLIESKSLKLYLNSLNNHRFADNAEACATIEADLSAVAGGPVALTLIAVDDESNEGRSLTGECLDDLCVTVPEAPDAGLLVAREGGASRFTHLMRSLCPVTAQPDWATVHVECRGRSPSADSLLAYLLAYRNHQEFHEQCVERVFAEIWQRIEPDYLTVQAFYTRRGGLDISPFRCSAQGTVPTWRLNRQ